MAFTAAWLITNAGLLTVLLGALAYRYVLKFPRGDIAQKVAIFAGIAYGASFLGLFSLSSVVGAGPSAAPVEAVSLASCPDDGTTDFLADVLSKSNTSGGGEYLVSTVSLWELDGAGAIKPESRLTYASSATATRTAALASLKCGSKYRAEVAMIRDNATSIYGGPIDFMAEGPVVVKTLYVDEHGGATGLTARGYDIDNAGFIFGNDSLDGTNTAYETVRTTLQGTTNNTAFVFGLDSTMNWRIQLAASPAGTVIGGARRTWACLDRATAETSAPVEVKFNGEVLAESKALMLPEDAAQISAFDDCYILPRPISDVQGGNNIEWKHRASAGQNPSTDMSWRFLGENAMLEDSNKLVYKIFRKSDSRQEFNSRDLSITVDIS